MFFIFVLLAILGIYTYFYISKAQISEDFTLEDIPIIKTLVLEFKANYSYNRTSNVISWCGEYPYYILPHYYNNTLYILVVLRPYYDMDNIYFRLYDTRTGSIVNEFVMENVSKVPSIVHYTDKSGKLIITFYFDFFRTLGIPSYKIYKMVVDKGNITEFREILSRDNLSDFSHQIIDIGVVFEGVDRDYILLVRGTEMGRDIRIIDEYGNIIYNYTYIGSGYLVGTQWVLGTKIYETNNTVIFYVVMYNNSDPEVPYYTFAYRTFYVSFDKNRKEFVNIWTRAVPSFPPSNRLFIIEYRGDLVVVNNFPKSDVVIMRDKIFETWTFFDLHKTILNIPAEIGWAKGDKIFFIRAPIIRNDTHIITYQIYTYSYDGNDIEIQKVSEGLFLNWTLPSSLKLHWWDAEAEILGLDDRYIQFFAEEDETLNDIYLFLRYLYVVLVDIENRKVNISKVVDYYFDSGTKGIPDNLAISYHYVERPKGMYRFLVSQEIANETWIINWTNFEKIYEEFSIVTRSYILSTYPIDQNITVKSLNICKTIFANNLTTNETNKTNGVQPQPQPGFGIVITAPEMNITIPPYNMTQNMTTTRRTGIQSVIEIIGRNWWLILLAILLLVLIAASLRRRSL